MEHGEGVELQVAVLQQEQELKRRGRGEVWGEGEEAKGWGGADRGSCPKPACLQPPFLEASVQLPVNC